MSDNEKDTYKDNICHEIIDRYKTEDLVRAFNCDIDYIKQYLLSNINDKEKVSELEKKYVKIIGEIESESITLGGRTSKTKTLIQKLNALAKKHKKENNEALDNIYQLAKPYILENQKIARKSGVILNDVEVCINACYGMLLLKIDQKKIDTETQKKVNAMGNYLASIVS